MRTDPYQARARELATAAGLNPDDRIGEGRGRPAWTDFRQAARDEHNAKEQAALSQDIAANVPQGDAYKDAPLLVIGEHEPSTVEQMKNCMKVGNVVAGVICADGHLGYAQPVGGVIAYDRQISVSGVGFDIGCGNMAVRLDVDYEDIRANIKQIAQDIQRVISFGTGRVNDERVEHLLFDRDYDIKCPEDLVNVPPPKKECTKWFVLWDDGHAGAFKTLPTERPGGPKIIAKRQITITEGEGMERCGCIHYMPIDMCACGDKGGTTKSPQGCGGNCTHVCHCE